MTARLSLLPLKRAVIDRAYSGVCYNSWRAPVAQLDRASDFESGGRGFESLRARSNQGVLFNSATLRASNAMYAIKTMRSSSRKP